DAVISAHAALVLRLTPLLVPVFAPRTVSAPGICAPPLRTLTPTRATRLAVADWVRAEMRDPAGIATGSGTCHPPPVLAEPHGRFSRNATSELAAPMARSMSVA